MSPVPAPAPVTVTSVDPLFVDVYAGDGPKDWKAFCAAGPPWSGAIFKCSQGTYYRPKEFAKERRAFLYAAGDRHGGTLFDGAYHYLDLSLDGGIQADYAMLAVDRAGGDKRGTLWLMVDVERGGQRIRRPGRALVEDRVHGFARRYEQITGRKATLYGGELLRDVGITSLLGCGRLAVALYGAELHGQHESTVAFLRRTGSDLSHLLLWQYTAAEGTATGPVGYPREAPGCGRVDISALVVPGWLDTLRSTLWAELPA